MTIEILEQFTMSKTGHPQDNEDAVFLGKSHVAVLDGVTSKSNRTWDGRTGGQYASDVLSNALIELPADVTARQAIDILTAAIHDIYIQRGLLNEMQKHSVERMMACLGMVSLERREIWLVGDCQCLLAGEHIYNNKLVDKIMSDARAMFLESELILGAKFDDILEHDSGVDYIFPLLERQSEFQNNGIAGSYSYGVIDGFHIQDSHIIVIPIPTTVEQVVLATDGYPDLGDTLSASEEALARVLHEDPLLFRKYKSTKGLVKGNASFDDRTYLKVRIR